MVDASTTCRMNPMATLGMDRSNMMRESLHVHGGIVYPGLKTQEASAMPLGYVPDLHYKHDVSLENRKATNGYIGLYKSPPPGLQKPLMVPGGDSLGLDIRVGPAEKQTDLGLNGGSSYLRLPWMSPYPDTGMYSFLDSSKYAALNMYKASFMSQPSPYLPQHLAYQSLCAGAGASAASADRLFYMPPYPPAPLSSPLAPPMRIPAATVATTPLSPLVHCQDKSMQSIGPRVHHEPSSFGQQLHQQQPPPHHHSHDDRLHSSKSSRISSSKGSGSSSSACSSSTISSSCSSLSVDSTATLLMQSSRTASRQTQPLVPPPPPLLIENSLDFQKPLPRGTSSSSSSSTAVSHPFYMSSLALEHSSPARGSSHKSKSKDGNTDHHRGSGGERKSSKTPPKTTSEKCIQQVPTKDPADKPLDLSSKMDFGTPPNGFNHRLEALVKLGHSPTTRYGLHPSQELKEAVSPPSSAVSTSSKPPERPEIISNLRSTWVVPSHGSASVLNVDSGQNKGPSVIKNKSLEQVIPQQRSSSCPRIGESNSSPPTNPTATVVTSIGRPASASPSPTVNGECPKSSPNLTEKSPMAGYVSSQPATGKSVKAPKRSESQEVTYKPQQPLLENGQTSSHLYLSQNETFMAPSLPYGNRYLPYPGPDSMPLHHLPLPGKVPVYPHPVLLNSSSLYPARLTPKHNLPYGMASSHGEFLTYHNSQEMVHPLMSPHITLDTKSSERLERRPKSQDKHRHNEDTAYMTCHTTEGFDTTRRPEKESENFACQTSKLQTKPQATVKEKIVCVDLIQNNTNGGGSERHSDFLANKGDPTRPASSRNSDSSDRKEQQFLSNQASSQSLAEPDKRAEISGKLKLQGQGCLPLSVCQDHASPVSSHGVESPAEKSPLLDLPEHQTLRCARTSGDRTSEESRKSERQGTELCNELNKHGPEETESHEDDDDSHSSSKTRRSSLAKRIANSSGYVGDRFKCITTELYADSSKLSREQRALQMEGLSQEDTNIKQSAAYWERAMLRFSELELKEKEGGAAASRELAGGQHSQAVWEGSQRSTRPEGTALSNDPGKEGLRPVSENNKVPVVQRCVTQNQSQPLREREQGWANREARVRERTREGGAVASEEPAGRPLTAEEKPLENVSLGTMPGRKRPHQREQAQAYQGEEEEEGAVLREKRSKQVTALQTTPLTPVHVDRVGSSCPDTGVKRVSLQSHKKLSDKRQRLKLEQQRAGGWWPPSTDREGDKGMDAEPAPRLRRQGDSDKPKGKRQCKTKHMSLRERRRALQTEEDCQDTDPSLEHKVTLKRSSRKRSESLSDISDCSPVKARPQSPFAIDTESPFSQPPSQPSPQTIGNPPVETPASRPMPPEARRLIVNKNAGETLLQRAARLGYEEVVLYCLENKVCDINHRDNAGYCALHEACARGWLSIVQHLVEHGADINCSAQDGTRPIHDAVENDHLDVVRLLLSYGADPTLATYSGRGLLKMTHSDVMECFLLDYFADLQGRDDDDPRLYWELYGSSVCEPPEDLAAFDVLANPPGPGNDDEQQQREVFEFEFSDRPLLPCYNIQVSLSQGPRNWLLLSDVLKRLKMSAQDFRTNFAHIEVVSIPEAEFYKQASLSQLFSCPEELEGFLPDSKEPLDLVEINRELVALLGSSLECLDDRWDPVSLTRS
ncbi:BCL-6 corepressor-like isoform X2 [Scleropages formosus]|uniref:BCL-6 corepressor-like isoform X2 n=1 Tax=Scleropages formosus TaxID=113540 RepID=UPI0010FACB81|nr:BCL-6 corepressor-like isoform X2 [Scleropages formosus]